jgi:hypothetical protein
MTKIIIIIIFLFILSSALAQDYFMKPELTGDYIEWWRHDSLGCQCERSRAMFKNIAVHRNLRKIGKDSAIAILGSPNEDFTQTENLRKPLKLKQDSFALVNTIIYYSYTLCDESETVPNLDSLHNVAMIKYDSSGQRPLKFYYLRDVTRDSLARRQD